MDIEMPVKDGIAATRDIIALAQLKGVKPPPIVALSGHNKNQLEQQQPNFYAYLQKPISLADIQQLMNRLQGGNGLQDGNGLQGGNRLQGSEPSG
jgi:CheY-like chemotaxis protein